MRISISSLRTSGCVAVALSALLFASGLPALSYVQMKDADLIAQADGAAEATVIGKPQPVFDAEGVRVAARYTLDVSDDLGRPVPARVQIQLPGWQDSEGSAWRVPGIVVLAPGDRIVVVYVRRADGVLLPLHLNLGVFIEHDHGSEAWLDRALEDAINAAPGTNATYGGARHSQRFKRYLRDKLAGGNPPVDYLLPAQARLKFTSLTGGGTPVRWFQFDQGTTVNWRANSEGQVGMVQDEFALLQTALAAWTNDLTSRIQLGYAGTIAPGAANPPTPYGRVLWNDPNGEIAGTYVCGTFGTLAIGGANWFVQPTNYRGTSYNPIQSGRMVTQDGAGCFFDSSNGANGAATFAHEIGHSLGFGHSCGDAQSPSCGSNPVLNDALMRAQVQSDGRGASLRVDDIAAANQWYFLSVAVDLIFANGFE